MKPFDLDAALRGEPVVTRDGKPVTQIVKLKSLKNPYCVIAVIDNDWHAFTIDGLNLKNLRDSHLDLFMAEKPKVKKEGWVIINLDAFRPLIDERIFTSKGDADVRCNYKGKNCVVTRIEWEEEQ